MQSPSMTYGIVTTVYFSAESLRMAINLYRNYPPVVKAQKSQNILLSFFRSEDNPDQVVAAQTAEKPTGALATKKDIKTFQAYHEPVAQVSSGALFDAFNDTKDMLEFIGSIKTVKDAQSYFPQ